MRFASFLRTLRLCLSFGWRIDHVGWRIVEEVDHVLMKDRPIGLQRQQVIAATLDDGLGDIGLGPHGVDGDERAGQFEPFEQPRNGDDLV